MAGRHAINREAAFNAFQTPAGRGAVAAVAVGAIFGVTVPAAHADEKVSEATLLGTISAPTAEEAVTSTEAVTAPVDAEWNVEQVSLSNPTDSVELSVSVDLPAATTQTTRTTQAATRENAFVPRGESANSATVSVSSEAPVGNSASGTGSAVLSTALSYVGSPYAWGGTTPSGWDCIGFVRYVYSQYGVSIGGYTTSVLSVGRRVPYSEAQPGDILYWPGHVAIYAGGGKNVGAWNESMGTKVGPNSWAGRPAAVIRVFN